MGRGHPECPERLDAIADHLIATGLAVALEYRQAAAVAESDLLLAHDGDHVEALRAFCKQVDASGEPRALDDDTVVGPGTWQAALHAAGAAVAATDAVLDGTFDNAFCAVRPPGHHATRRQAMGFCFFNNVAIAACHALTVRGLERVAVVDFDVHHGNGTEDILAGDERMLMVGFFQHPLYPGSGSRPLGDNILNVPLSPFSKGPQMRQAIEQQCLPRLEAFRPQMIFISAGFDAHREDDISHLGLVETDYAWITERIKRVAERHAKGRIVSCLEGGYALSALGRSVASHLRVLADLAH